MKKKTLALLLTTALCLSLTLSSCSSKKEVCSVDGCSQEVYKDGLCADHYVDAALSEAAASSEVVDPVLAEAQEKYQGYIDTAIQTLQDSLKNPKSLDIYNIYLKDGLDSEINPLISICIDAAAENSYGGTIRSSFTFQEMTKTNHISLYECKQDWQTEFFDYVKSVCTGQHTSELEEQLAEKYYHYVFVSKNTGKTVDDGYYLLVPEAWYTNS